MPQVMMPRNIDTKDAGKRLVGESSAGVVKDKFRNMAVKKAFSLISEGSMLGKRGFPQFLAKESISSVTSQGVNTVSSFAKNNEEENFESFPKLGPESRLKFGKMD